MSRPDLPASSGLTAQDSRASSRLPSPALTASSSTLGMRSRQRLPRTRLASSSSSDGPSTPPTSSPGSAPLRSDDRDADPHPLLPAPRLHIQGLTLSPLPRILIIDHFDSYTRNLVPLLLAASCTSSRDDSDRIVVLPYTSPALHPANFPALAAQIDAILISPGPGHPASADDFGPSAAILRGMREGTLPVVPVLGVCLGFQGMAVLEGGKLREGQGAHGLRCSLEWTKEEGQSGLYKGLEEAKTEVVRYNSLVLVDQDLPPAIIATSWSSTDLPLAPDPSSEALSLLTSAAFAPRPPRSAQRPERIVMSLRHASFPFVGVQYHPESIESQFGHAILANWICEVWSFWEVKEGRKRQSEAASDEPGALPQWIRMLDANFAGASQQHSAGMSGASGSLDIARMQLLDASKAASRAKLASDAFWTLFLRRGWTSTSRSQEGEQWWEAMSKRRHGEAERDDGCVWLDSARHGDPQSQYSYMCRPSFWLAYDAEGRGITVRARNASTSSRWTTSHLPLHEGETFWSFIDEVQREVQSRLAIREEEQAIRGGPAPFRAGFVGFWGYEMHRESLPSQGPTRSRWESDVTPSAVQAVADAELGWADVVLQVDHRTGEWHGCALVSGAKGAFSADSALGRLQRAVQEAGVPSTALLGQPRDEAQASLAELRQRVQRLATRNEPPVAPPAPKSVPSLTPLDDAELYKAKVEGARSAISKGDSYELCLTTHFTGRGGESRGEATTTTKDHFATYLSLRGRNPAPYAAFISLPPVEGDGQARTLLSTSPERFISLTESGLVEMRPIKGTVPRAGFDRGEEHMRAVEGGDGREEEVKLGWREKEDAKRRNALECDAKERAENLMIVDLIRSDLLTFCEARSVVVPRLMHVETYETLHQLVTTVCGLKLRGIGSIEGVKRAFPPGSMTGAPKVRSVELLHSLEGESDAGMKERRRGPYSGAMGWCDVGGAACYAVIIRTLVAHGNDFAAGAGGAVTYLSSPEREWKECCDKARTLAEVRAVE